MAGGNERSTERETARITRLRRLAIVALMWAIAGSAVGLIALLEERSGADDERRTTAAALDRLQRSLNERIDTLDRKLAEQQDTVASLEGRIEEAEGAGKDAARVREQLQQIRDDLKELSEKVDEQP